MKSPRSPLIISPKEGQLTRLLGEERLFALFAFEGDEITALCLAGQEEMALLSREDKPFASVWAGFWPSLENW